MAPARLRTLADEVARRFPDLPDPKGAVVSGSVLVNGIPVTNPASVVRPDASIALSEEQRLRGELKLGPALERFGVRVADRVALDAGAAAGGFTRALLERGARRVYAVEVGYGQLLGSLRQEPRVVSLERTNVGDLDEALVPEPVELVTLDLGYLALADGVPQLGRLRLDSQADLVALVKPMFELRLHDPPTERADLDRALDRAKHGIAAAGWTVVDAIDSEVRGSRGAAELFVHARRSAEGHIPS
jgi:23S rRNA (cytidine1920-2'-O)/16S rRNA (cytidine1409-2'-O)-methyltransferase